MNVKVHFVNSDPEGPHTLEFPIHHWDTERGELRLYRTEGDRPDVVFAPRQWVWIEAAPDPEQIAARCLPKSGPKKSPHNGEARPGDVRSHTMSGPMYEPRRPSDLQDLTIADPVSVERARAASVQFAIDGHTVPWSEAHMRALKHYEEQVRSEYGDDAVLALPWNRIPRGTDLPKAR